MTRLPPIQIHQIFLMLYQTFLKDLKMKIHFLVEIKNLPKDKQIFLIKSLAYFSVHLWKENELCLIEFWKIEFQPDNLRTFNLYNYLKETRNIFLQITLHGPKLTKALTTIQEFRSYFCLDKSSFKIWSQPLKICT